MRRRRVGLYEAFASLADVVGEDLIQAELAAARKRGRIPEQVAELLADLVGERPIAGLISLALLVLGREAADLTGEAEQRQHEIVRGENVRLARRLLILADVHGFPPVRTTAAWAANAIR